MATTGERGTDGTTYRLVHRWDDDRTVGDRIVAAVAEHEGVDRASLPTIAHSVDPEALDALFDTTSDDGPRPGCVTFSYYGYTVLVQSTGQILLRRE